MFLRQNSVPPKGEKPSCRKLYTLNARNATTIIHSIATAKMQMVIKSISAGSVTTSLRPTDRAQRGMEWRKLVGRRGRMPGHILHARFAGRQASCTMIMIITAIIAVVTSTAITRFSFGKTLLLLRRPCQACLVNTISSECVTLFTL